MARNAAPFVVLTRGVTATHAITADHGYRTSNSVPGTTPRSATATNQRSCDTRYAKTPPATTVIATSSRICGGPQAAPGGSGPRRAGVAGCAGAVTAPRPRVGGR